MQGWNGWYQTCDPDTVAVRLIELADTIADLQARYD